MASRPKSMEKSAEKMTSGPKSMEKSAGKMTSGAKSMDKSAEKMTPHPKSVEKVIARPKSLERAASRLKSVEKVPSGRLDESHSMILKSAVEVRNKLVIEWNKGITRDFSVLDKYLSSAKVLLTKMTTYLPLTKDVENFKREIEVARELLELGARASIAKMAKERSDKTEEFDRYIAQLKHYYFDMNFPSEHMNEMIGMHLLKLLSQNRISEFHVELELLLHTETADVMMTNVYIQKAVQMERYLTEGRYNKILELHTASDMDLRKEGLVSSGFRFFVERVIESSRTSIAQVIEAAYEKLQVNVALKSLHAREDQLDKIARERGWVLENGYIFFNKGKVEEDTLPSDDLIRDSLEYAKEWERIV